MKITLISPYPDITAFGVRTISAFLKEKGYEVQLIFLPDPHGDELEGVTQRYEEQVMDQVVELCRPSDLIGISLMTNFFDGAVQITSALKEKLDTMVLWGGVHPTIRPEECIRYADIVCIGEAEDAIITMLDKMAAKEAYWETKNFWFKHNNRIIRNELSPLPAVLDKYPPPDYSCQDHHVMVQGEVIPLKKTLIESFLRRGTVSDSLGLIGYQTMTSRGCPYNCTYCINHTIKQMYGGKGKLRWRSIDHVISELQWVKINLPFVNYIWFSDDEFMARRNAEIEYFCQEYKKKIDLPFSCLVSAISITEAKMKMLVDAGLIYVQMGVESGSKRMQAHFKRTHITNKKMMKAMKILNRFKDRMHPPSYDFLLDVPGETDADRIESLRFISMIPKPFRLQPFKVILYPGTRLHELAMKRGDIIDEHKEIYNNTYTMHKKDYLNLLFVVAKGGKLPAWVLRAAISPLVAGVLNTQMMSPVIESVYLSLRTAYRTLKRVHP